LAYASDTLPQEVDDSPQKSGRTICLYIEVMQDPSFTCGPGQQACCGGESGAAGGFSQAANASRAAEANRPIENSRGQITHTDKLAGAAGEDDTATGRAAEAGAIEPVAHHFERFLQPGANDAYYHAARNFGELVIFFSDQLHRQDFTLVFLACMNVSVQRFQPFRMINWC
jgi:hypothetical protein